MALLCKHVAGREAKGGFNFGQVVLKRALLWNKMPSIMKVCHPSSFKTKVMVDVEGAGLAVGEADQFIANP